MQVRTSIKVLGALLSVSLMFVGCAQTPTSPEISTTVRITADPSCTTFYVSNLSTRTIGSVSITGAGVQQAMSIGGTGSLDSSTVCFTPDGVIVGTTSCPYPTTTTVTLPTGTVSVLWTGNYEIAIKDFDEQS